MSTIRVCRQRFLRLNLSTRYQLLQRRAQSTTSPSPPPPPPPPPNPSFFRRYRTNILWGSLALTLGVVGGQLVVHTISPPALPAIGTHEDGVLLADLNKRIDEEFKVKVLRGKCLGVAKQLKGQQAGWFEVLPTPLEVNEESEKESDLIAQMQGAKGIGAERIFWNRKDETLVAVVWFGGALCGWPGVVHGGALATEMAEKLSLAAALADKDTSDRLAAAMPQRLPGTGDHAKMLAPATTPAEPAQLSIGYVKPTYANHFYVIRVKPAVPQEKESQLTPEPYGGASYEATLETQDATVCVKARARFAPSTRVQRAQKKAGDGVTKGYEEFKEWMWPSRQKQSQIQ